MAHNLGTLFLTINLHQNLPYQDNRKGYIHIASLVVEDKEVRFVKKSKCQNDGGYYLSPITFNILHI